MLLTVVVLLVPGALLARTLLVDRDREKRGLDPVEWLTWSLAYGIAGVGSLTFILVAFLGIFTRIFVSAWLYTGVALVLSALVAAWLWWLHGQPDFGKVAKRLLSAATWKKWVRSAPLSRWVLLLGLAVFAVYLLNFNRQAFDEERCLIRAAVLPVHNYLSADTPMSWMLPESAVENNAFLHWNGGQRLGSALFSGLTLSLFGFSGFRIAYALTGLLIFLGSFLAAREVTGRPGAALFGAAALALSPYLLQIDVFDENLLACAVSALAIPLLLRKPRDIVGAAALVALLVGVRHVAVLWYPAIAAHLWLSGKKGRRGGVELAAFGMLSLLFLSPYIYKHARDIPLYSVPYESFLSNPPALHSFFGAEFSYRGLLNWPFVEHMVRSPFSPLPPALGFPVAIADRFGVLLTGLLLTGFLWCTKQQGRGASEKRGRGAAEKRGRGALILLGLHLPVALVLAVQSNWVEPAKMFILVTVMAPFAVWLAGGIAWIMDRDAKVWVRLVAPAGACLIVWGAVGLATRADYPVDQRNFDYRKEYLRSFRQAMLDELPVYVETRRAQLSDRNLLPSLKNLSLLKSPKGLGLRMRHLVGDLSAPDVDDMVEPDANKFRRLLGFDKLMHFPVTSMRETTTFAVGADPLPTDFPRVTLSMDLSLPLVGREGFASVEAPQAALPRPTVERALIIRGLDIAWAKRKANLMVVASEPGVFAAMLMFEPAADARGLEPPFSPGAASDGYLPSGRTGRDVYSRPGGFDPMQGGFPTPEELAKTIGPIALMRPFDGVESNDEVSVVDWPEGAPPTVRLDLPEGSLLVLEELTSFAPNLSFAWYLTAGSPGTLDTSLPTARGM